MRSLLASSLAKTIDISARLAYGALVPFFPKDREYRLRSTAEIEQQSYYELGVDHFANRIKGFGLDGFNTVLEVGSGNGRWLCAFSGRGSKVVGVEPQAEAVFQTKEHVSRLNLDNIGVLQGRAEELPIQSESVDLCFCYGVLMYCEKTAAVSEMNRVLRDGGTYFIAVQGPGYALALMRNGLRARDPGYFRTGFNRFIRDVANLGMPWMYHRPSSKTVPQRVLTKAIRHLNWSIEKIEYLDWMGMKRPLFLSVFYYVQGTKCSGNKKINSAA